MPVKVEELEQAIRDAFPVSHLKIEDKSSGCGENYSIFLVSEVRTRSVFHRSTTEEPSKPVEVFNN
ncbi:hypothetical protein EV363DRAFT_1167946 [Boletus edulis]|nr:hypothetical protein EV363DRAFT_1167946 [Boletus edulis]